MHWSSCSDVTKQFFNKHLQETPPPNPFLCTKEYLEGTRHANEEEYIPKWKRDKSKRVLLRYVLVMGGIENLKRYDNYRY